DRSFAFEINGDHVFGLGLVKPVHDVGEESFRTPTLGGELGWRHAPAGALKSGLHRVVDFLSPLKPVRVLPVPNSTRRSRQQPVCYPTRATRPRIGGFDTDFQPWPPVARDLAGGRCPPAAPALRIARIAVDDNGES